MAKYPKYKCIIDDIIAHINSGKYCPGSELSSETELTELYGVSRITVRRAIDELYRAGYIEKKQGRRCCIREATIAQELTTVSSYTEEILRQGMTPARKVLRAELRLADDEEQKILKLDKADPVFYLSRIIYADHKPLCYSAVVLPYNLFRDIETFDFAANSLYDVIEHKYNVKITKSVLKLKAVSADISTASYLDVAEEIPLLYSSAITYGIIDGKEIPIEKFETHYLTDLFEYTLTQLR